MSIRQLLAFTAVSLLATAAAAADAPNPASPTVIRIGLPAQPGSDGKLVSGIPSENIDRFLQKEFAGQGTRIEWKLVTGAGPGINEAIAGGALDFAYYGDFPSIIGRAGGLKTKLVVAGERGHNSYLVVPIDSTAKSIKDLVGKRVAINKGRPWELALSRLLSADGLKEGDLQLFNLAPADGEAALAAHSIDALYTSAGYQAEEKGIGKIIWSTRPQPLDWKFTAEIFVTDAFAKSFPAATQKVVNAYVAGAYYAAQPEHRDEILRALVTASAPYSTIVKDYDGIALRDAIIPLIDPFLRAHYEQAIAYAAETKLIRKPIPIDDWFDPQYVDAAVKSLGLAGFWAPEDSHGQPEDQKRAAK